MVNHCQVELMPVQAEIIIRLYYSPSDILKSYYGGGGAFRGTLNTPAHTHKIESNPPTHNLKPHNNKPPPTLPTHCKMQ